MAHLCFRSRFCGECETQIYGVVVVTWKVRGVEEKVTGKWGKRRRCSMDLDCATHF